MWHLVQGNILEFIGMFKDSYEDENLKYDLNRQSRLFPRMQLGPRVRALVM